MASIYDVFADSCNALAAKTKNKSDSLLLLQLAGQWRTVPADRVGTGRKPPTPVALTNEILNGATLLAPQVRGGPSATAMIKSKAEALDKATDAIGVLRELGLDNDTILSYLGLLDPSQESGKMMTGPGKLRRVPGAGRVRRPYR